MSGLRLIQLSDCHLFSDTEKTAYNNTNPYQTLRSVLRIVEAEKPDILLFTGDMSGDDSEQSYAHLKQLLTPFSNTQVRMIPGNHDVPALLSDIFDSISGDTFNEHVARFGGFEDLRTTNWRIHYLNSHFEGTKGRIEVSRLAELEHDVTAAPAKSHLIVVHHHPLDTINWMDKHDWANRNQFLQLMYRLPGEMRVLYGHVHHASHRVFCGQHYYSCPSTCWQWAQTDNFGVSNEQPGCRIIELHEQGGWHTEIKRVEPT